MKKILSIHSSVMVGFVGNSVVAPVLSTLGHAPLMINTVTLPAHPGYGLAGGGATSPDDITAFLGALETLGAYREIEIVISGYMGSLAQLVIIGEAIEKWQSIQPKGCYIFDPVLGDNDTLYIDAGLADAMVDHLLPLAQIITPNQFELGYLAGQPVQNKDDAVASAQILLARNTNLQAVVATGIDDQDQNGDLLVQRIAEPHFAPALDTGKNVSGGGDLLTSLLAGHIANGAEIPAAFIAASQKTQRVLAASPSSRELALRENLALLAS